MGTREWAGISKEIEFDAGHRIPNHESKCYNIHGHRYKVRACCRGFMITAENAPDEGMLIDFGLLKTFMTTEIHDVLDHGLMLHRGDSAGLMAMELLGELLSKPQKVIEFPYVPTAENIARWCYEKLQPLVEHHFRENLKLDRIEVHETPTSLAWYPEVHH